MTRLFVVSTSCVSVSVVRFLMEDPGSSKNTGMYKCSYLLF